MDPETGTLDIARAGHPDPVVISSDGTAVIRQTGGGLPLGVETDADYPTTQLVLETGETIMLCTDGLIETGGHDMATGWDRLRPVLEQRCGDLEKLADELVQAVHGPTSHYTTGPLADRREDDVAVLVLRREAGTMPRTAPRRTAMTIAQAEPERISAARQQLRELLHDWEDPERIDAAELMVSELTTNVLVHTDGDALMVAEATGERGQRRLRVEVADGSDELPHKRRPGEMASSGRGLVLMEVLADAWGVDPRGRGSRSGSSCTSRRERGRPGCVRWPLRPQSPGGLDVPGGGVSGGVAGSGGVEGVEGSGRACSPCGARRGRRRPPHTPVPPAASPAGLPRSPPRSARS